MEIKKVSLIGLGAMGAFFAPRLAQTLGEGFTVVASGERRERLETRGVTINGVNYKFPIADPKDRHEPADLVIIATKDTGLAAAIEDIASLVGPGTQIMSVLNGTESEEKVAAAYGWERVLWSYMRASIAMKDGVADFDPNWGEVHFGERKNDGPLTGRVLAIKALFDRAKIPYEIDADMIFGIWRKFMSNSGENMTCALLGIPFGYFRWCDDANAIREAAMREVVSIAQKKGIGLSERDVARQSERVKNIPYANKPSTLQDLEAGRPTELEMFAGAVLRMGRETGVETPVNWMFYHAIKTYEAKNRERERPHQEG